jgi:hypothetical protein
MNEWKSRETLNGANLCTTYLARLGLCVWYIRDSAACARRYAQAPRGYRDEGGRVLNDPELPVPEDSPGCVLSGCAGLVPWLAVFDC